MRISFTSQPIDKIQSELIVLMHFEGQLPFKDLLGTLDWRLNGRLSDFVKQQRYTGKAKELLLIPSEFRLMADEVIVLGLGKKRFFDEAHISQVLDFLIETIDRKKAQQVCFSLNQLLDSEFDWRNALRLMLSKLNGHDHPGELILREPAPFIRDAKRRQLDFGAKVEVEFQ